MRKLLLICGLAAVGFALLAGLPAPEPLPAHPFLAGPRPLVFAHRGGAGLWPENTLRAFREAAALGVDVIEMDVRRSADGHLVAFHDPDLDRTTDGRGALSTRTVAELKALDAGHRFSLDGGRTFPFRGLGLRVPTLTEVFRSVSGTRMNLELKTPDPASAEALCAQLRRHDLRERVLVASFHQEPIDAFRAACPGFATAATPGEAWRFYVASSLRLTNLVRPTATALQLFERMGPFPLVTPRLVSHARELNLPVHVWRVDGVASARQLIESGVAGIMTDRPDRLLALLGRGNGALESISAGPIR